MAHGAVMQGRRRNALLWNRCYQDKFLWNHAFCHQSHQEDSPAGELQDISLFPSKGLTQLLLKEREIKNYLMFKTEVSVTPD